MKEERAVEMGLAGAKILTPDNKTYDIHKAVDRDEDNLWEIIENGHQVTHHDFLFGIPKKMSSEKPASLRRPSRRRSRKGGDVSERRWVSRLYIDPLTSPRVTDTSRVEVCLLIDNGQITKIENAQPVVTSRVRKTRAVSYLHVCVVEDNKKFKMEPVDMGSFYLPDYSHFKPDLSEHRLLCALLKKPFVWQVSSRGCPLRANQLMISIFVLG